MIVKAGPGFLFFLSAAEPILQIFGGIIKKVKSRKVKGEKKRQIFYFLVLAFYLLFLLALSRQMAIICEKSR